MRTPKNTSPHRNVPLMIAYFAHTSDAEIALSELISEGVSEQDFSLVKLGEVAHANHLDALENVVEPFGNLRVLSEEPGEGSSDRESQIGGGIETANPDDDVSAIEEMDESETIAEAMLYPSSGHSIGEEDASDIQKCTTKGFMDTNPRSVTHFKRAERMLDEFEIPGFGIVIGEGGFGECLQEASISHGLSGVQSVIDYYLSLANTFAIISKSGGSILAIDVDVTSPIEDRMTDILKSKGALSISVVNPRDRLRSNK